MKRGNPNWKKGESGNPAGRPKGSKNKITQEIREQFSNILENRMPLFDDWLMQTAQNDPAKAMEIVMKLSERFLPVLSRSEISGIDGEPIGFEFKFGQKTQKADEDEE